MEKPLKDTNRLSLFAALAANLALYYALMHGLDLSTITASNAITHLKLIFPSGLAIALCGLMNAQLTPTMKARIVFMRWLNPLPGSEAFSKHAREDDRIDMEALKSKWGSLPSEPRAQNTLWYRIYLGERETPVVSHISRNWLFARDYTCIIALLLPLLGLAGIFQLQGIARYLILIGLLLAQFLFARQAAQTNAIRLVTTVIAQASSKPVPPQPKTD